MCGHIVAAFMHTLLNKINVVLKLNSPGPPLYIRGAGTLMGRTLLGQIMPGHYC